MTNKQLILIRGLPGSGKTTMAKRLLSKQPSKSVHLEADMYFTNFNGEYHFDASKLADAHHWCQTSTKQALMDPTVTTVVVSNTFVKHWEIQKYLDIAKEVGVSIKILTATGNYANVHGVPLDTIEKMRSNWENTLLIKADDTLSNGKLSWINEL